MTPRWRRGNHVELLESGEQFFPRVFAAIEAARHEILVETFILAEDDVGHRLARVLKQAAQRGVRVELTVDAWGSMALSRRFKDDLTGAGVCLHLFEEKRPRWLLRVAWFRRLHRKLVVVDGGVAFVGGINFSQDHLMDAGPEAKHDFAVAVEGPVVVDVRRLACEAIQSVHGEDLQLCSAAGGAHPQDSGSGSVRAAFIVRDNRRGRRTAIEKHYRAAIRQARERLIIANAYFFPGHLLLREIRRAARRGVDVRLVMQSEPDIAISKFAEKLLYDYLLRDGVRIYEYCARQFHGKVALIDDDWATVGSSNLEPLSLWFNLEGNVVVRDRSFNDIVYERIDKLMRDNCREVPAGRGARRGRWRAAGGFLAYHLLRRFPRFAGLLPAHQPRLTRVVATGKHPGQDEAR